MCLLLHLPGRRVTREDVDFGTGSLLTDSDADRKPEKKVFHKLNNYSYVCTRATNGIDTFVS